MIVHGFIHFLSLNQINNTSQTNKFVSLFYYNNQSPTRFQVVNSLKMSSISESKNLNRGPLIAVIKIELDTQNIDRIFLHLKDNDEDLADEFVQKHSLNPILKRHIFQRIQTSRQAVDKNKINRPYEQQDYQDQYQYDSFTTPISKKNPIFNQSSDKKPGTSQKAQHQAQKKNFFQTYITYDDSEPQQGNDTFEQRYPSSYEHRHPKIFDWTKGHNPSQQRHPLPTRQLVIQLPNHQLDEIRDYNRGKYKNLYDVSGLKLKSSSSIPSISHDTSNEVSSKHSGDEYASSQSSQGLFEMELSNQKIYHSNANENFIHNSPKQEPMRDLKRNHSDGGYHYEPNAFRKERIPEFRNVPESEINKYEPFNPSVYQSSSISKLWKHSQINQRGQKQPQEFTNKPFLAINKENQTKFSSIEKLSQTDLMDLNYISFSKPQYQIAFSAEQLQKNNYTKESFSNPDQQLFRNPQQHNKKKVGSIRSNTKNNNDTQNSINSQKEAGYNQKVLAGYQEVESGMKFSQQKSFTNIKDIQNPKNLQQNRHINTDSSRPTVKFYNKQDMKSLKKSNLSKSVSKSQLSRINAEVTSRLYNQVEIKKKYLDTIRARAKNLKQEERQAIEQLREKPEINTTSKILAQNRIKENKKLEDYLIDQGKILQLKRQQMANRQARKQLQQCSFRPYINEQSQRLSALQGSRSTSKLFNHSEIKCSKRTYNNESTFQPEINKLSSAIARDKGNFNQRQNAFIEEKNSNLFKKLQQQRMKEKTDQVSGQRLFQPQLTQRTLKLAKQSVQKTRDNKPIHSYLYELSKIPRKQQKIDQRPSINPESQKLILQLQQKRLNWLFLELDSDEDGVISSRRICIDQIPTEILEIIAPVLYEMEELNTELNIEDFKCAIRNLNRGLDPYQKSLLYNYNYSVKTNRT